MNKSKIYSFDGTEAFNGLIERPEKFSELFKIANAVNGCIPRGAGLSFCCATSGEGVTSLEMTKFNRILEFNKESGTITVEAGIKIGDFIQFIIQQGWYFSVVPGYPSITIGGCIAFNVHGKSQFSTGTFCDHILSLTLYHPDYGEMKCSNTLNKDIFDLTTGGFGLTGVILDVTIQLTPLSGNRLVRKNIKCTDLYDAVEKMILYKSEYENVYSWNNLNLSGKSFGKGIVYAEKLVTGPQTPFPDYTYDLFDRNRRLFTFNFLNGFTTDLMCLVYYKKDTLTAATTELSLSEGIFPIYGKEIYRYLFGKTGYREYQVIIPNENYSEFFFELQQTIVKLKVPVTLGSLKLFKGDPKYLNFCTDGVCLANDVPANEKAVTFFKLIDELTIKFNGIANLSKDGRLSSSTIAEMYNQYNPFKTEILKYDPGKRFTSSFIQRIGV